MHDQHHLVGYTTHHQRGALSGLRASACVAAAVMKEHFLESAAVEQAMTGCVHYSPPEGAQSVQRASACVAAAAAGSRRIQASSNGRCAVCRVQTHPVETSQNLRHC